MPLWRTVFTGPVSRPGFFMPGVAVSVDYLGGGKRPGTGVRTRKRP